MAIINLDQKLKQARKAGYSDDQIRNFLTTKGEDMNAVNQAITSTQLAVKPSYGSQVLEAAKAGVDRAGQGFEQAAKPEATVVDAFESGIKLGEGAVQTVSSPLAPAFKPVGDALKVVTDFFANFKGVQDFANTPAGEVTARVAEDVAGLSTIAGMVAGGRTTPKVAGAVSRAGEVGVTKAGEVATRVGEAVQPIATGVADVTKMATQGVGNIPARIATNVAEKQASELAIKQLPSKVAQQAARDGIELPDIKTIYNTPKAVKPIAKELVDTAVKFAKRESDVDPIEVVGRPIIAKVKELESLKGTVGQKLGAVADTLGTVSATEMVVPVFNALKGVPGLSGITMGKGGILNFKNTVLATAATKADRAAIQRIFTDAVKGGTGKQKHLLRQELFEVLGGKKKAGVQLTDTQAKAFDAIRKGLSDVLETKNGTYKDLSNQYRRVIQPISEMRKAMQAIPGVAEDILDMNAGLLARRLTSTSLSQGKVRAILDAMDNATLVKGTLRETTESMQNLYNVLDKYYDLAPSTGFQGQIKAGIESSRGIMDTVTGALRSVAGETTAVRQKAIENAIKEALGD